MVPSPSHVGACLPDQLPEHGRPRFSATAAPVATAAFVQGEADQSDDLTTWDGKKHCDLRSCQAGTTISKASLFW